MLGGARVGLLHGRLSGDEKAAALAAFASGDTPVLISTTVVEVRKQAPVCAGAGAAVMAAVYAASNIACFAEERDRSGSRLMMECSVRVAFKQRMELGPRFYGFSAPRTKTPQSMNTVRFWGRRRWGWMWWRRR